MRPIEAQAVADRAAQQLVDRNPQRLRLQIDQRVLDRPDRLLVHPARRGARHAMEERGMALHRPWVHSDEASREAADHLAQTLRAVGLHELRPAGQTLVGADPEE